MREVDLPKEIGIQVEIEDLPDKEYLVMEGPLIEEDCLSGGRPPDRWRTP